MVKGHIKLSGLSGKVAFRTHGKVMIKVMRGGKLVARATVKLTKRGTYRTSFTFTEGQLPGSGRLVFHISYTGNQQLLRKLGRSQVRFYGPSYQLLHRLYGLTVSKNG